MTTTTGTDVDSHCPLAAKGEIHDDFDAMLNQTNIGANNNKFYVIQLVRQGGKYYVWNRWGRVGEDGQNSLKGPLALDGATKEFEKKFKDKTGNAWEARKTFKSLAGKYTLIEIDHAADQKKVEEREAKLHALKGAGPVVIPVAPDVKPSTLVAPVQNFMRLIFDHDMFKGAMASFEIDVEKMPLGQLTKSQVSKGFDALEAVEQAMNGGRSSDLPNLTSKFYTLIPHSFGRRIPPVIATPEVLQKKRDMLNVLADIEIALGMQNKKPEGPAVVQATVPHPDDLHYQSLKTDLTHVPESSPEFEYIHRYLDSTAAEGRKPAILDVFKAHRHNEDVRYRDHDPLGNRKLLWHGTNVAVVAAILGSGLRIMPHSGGRVGRGIYLASENGKSIWYVNPAGKTGVMFLAEAALGTEHHITRDNSSLREPPKGYDSIVAKGHGEPDPAHDITVDFEGRPVVIPQGKVIKMPKFSKSSFSQSEYLVYKESQVRIRYVIKIRMA